MTRKVTHGAAAIAAGKQEKLSLGSLDAVARTPQGWPDALMLSTR